MKRQDPNELCAKCQLTYDGHISNTGVLHPCWTPSGKIKAVQPKFTGATCRGSLAIGSGCGTCEKCIWEHMQRTPACVAPPAPAAWTDPSTDEFLAAAILGRIWTAKTPGETARWSNVLNHLRAAVLGDRKEAEAEKAIQEVVK